MFFQKSIWLYPSKIFYLEMNKVNKKWVVLLSVVVGLLLAPLLGEHFEILMTRSHYQWAPILVLFVLAVFAYRWRVAPEAESYTPRWILFSGLMFSFVLLAVAYLYYTSWVATAALICAIGVLACYLAGFRRVEGLFGLWMLLFLLVRLPNQIEGRLLILFQNISAKLASVVIDFSGTYHVVQGGFLVIDEYEIELTQICSGLFSIVSVLALTALYGFWRKHPTFHMILLLPGAFAAGVVVNILRVATVAIVYANTGEDLMLTSWVYLMAVVSFILSLLFILSLDSLITFFLLEVQLDGGRRTGSTLVRAWNGCVNFRVSKFLKVFTKPISSKGESKSNVLMVSVLSVSLILLTAFESVVMYYQWGFGNYQTYFMHDKESLVVVDSDKVTFSRPGWELISVEEEEREMSSIWGAYSTVWRLKYHDTMVIFALDYPFDKWHDVKRCYTKLGWQVQTEGLLPYDEFRAWGASQTELVLPTGDYGFILCSHCDHLGEIVQPKPTDHQFSMVLYYLHPKQWTAPFGVSVDKNANTFYQTQMMVTAAFELDEPTKDEIRLMYGEFREQTRALIEQHSVK